MEGLKSLLINKEKSIFEAMKQLDQTAKRILFVVDDNNTLIGSLSDGDIRRYIIKTGQIYGKAENACNKNLYYVNTGFDKYKIKSEIKSKDIKYIPVVDNEKKIIEILINEENKDNIIVNSLEKLNIPVVIMAGGYGTRLEPFTKVLPKPLIPIGDKTIIEVIIEKFTQFGISNFWISINYKSSIIKAYLNDLSLPNINFIEEEKPLGTIGSLFLLKNKINEDYFILTNCDIIIDADFYDIFCYHKNKKNDITLIVSMQTHKIPYGVCKIMENGILTSIDEKPEYNFLISTGIYMINSNVIDLIPDNTFFHATDLLEKANKNGLKIGVYPISQNSWIDIGQWDEYKKVLERYRIL